MKEPLPLSREDRDILALESARVAGHTCKVVVLGDGAPSVEDLRSAMAARLPAMLTWRLGGTQRAPAWVEAEDFRIEDHVVAGGATTDLPSAVAELFEQRLDRSRPLWRMDVLELQDGATALVWRIHHALADGQTCLRLAAEALWDAAPATRPPLSSERRQPHVAGFLHRELSTGGRSPFDGRVSARRRIAFATVALGELHDAAKSLAGATLNDAVLSVTAGALRRWTEERHGRLGRLRARVPVSLHREGEDTGNRDSFFCVALPLDEADPVARLRATTAETALCKAEHDAEEMDLLRRELAGVSPSLERLCERIEAGPRHFALSVSNVPGPRQPVSVLGAPVQRLHFVAEIGQRHALRVSVNSFADRLSFGLCADPSIVEGLETMADAFESEARALVAAGG